MAEEKKSLRCSFCGKHENQVHRMIQGPGVRICDECVQLCMSILDDGYAAEGVAEAYETPDQLPTPREIKEVLDQYVVGQESAKIALSVSVYNHYKRIYFGGDEDVELQKSNILMIGPTGSGKTLFAQTLAKVLHVPFAIADATTLTEAGYVGEDVENCLVGLLQSCDYNLNAAQMGIVMLDEGDKLLKSQAGPSINKDVSGECVQQSLLKIVEGTRVGVPPMGGRKPPEQPLIYVDTTNILFILSGAFVGIEDNVKKRLGCQRIGFDTNKETETIKDFSNINTNEYITPQDIRDYGFIPEFVGRFPIITYVDKLDEKALVNILEEPKNSIVKQYTKLLSMDNVKLKFEKEALYEIAHLANLLGTGARGLRTIVETIMTDFMFQAPTLAKENEDTTIIITSDIVKEKTKKKYANIKKER